MRAPPWTTLQAKEYLRQMWLRLGQRRILLPGLGPLRKNQWEGIWPNIAEFKIDLDSVRGGGDGNSAWGIATWISTGFDENGNAFDRPGRSTVILERRRTNANPGW